MALLVATVPGDLLGRLESASLGFSLGLPFLTSNLLPPVLFPVLTPPPTAAHRIHTETRTCLHTLTHTPSLCPGALPRSTGSTWANLSAKC